MWWKRAWLDRICFDGPGGEGGSGSGEAGMGDTSQGGTTGGPAGVGGTPGDASAASASASGGSAGAGAGGGGVGAGVGPQGNEPGAAGPAGVGTTPGTAAATGQTGVASAAGPGTNAGVGQGMGVGAMSQTAVDASVSPTAPAPGNMSQTAVDAMANPAVAATPAPETPTEEPGILGQISRNFALARQNAPVNPIDALLDEIGITNPVAKGIVKGAISVSPVGPVATVMGAPNAVHGIAAGLGSVAEALGAEGTSNTTGPGNEGPGEGTSDSGAVQQAVNNLGLGPRTPGPAAAPSMAKPISARDVATALPSGPVPAAPSMRQPIRRPPPGPRFVASGTKARI